MSSREEIAKILDHCELKWSNERILNIIYLFLDKQGGIDELKFYFAMYAIGDLKDKIENLKYDQGE